MMSNTMASTSLRIQWILCSIGIAVLGLYAALGVYNRPYADDLCMAATANQMGVIGAVSHTYWTWSGNVTGLFYQIIGAAYSVYAIAPLFLLTVWTLALTSLSYEILSVLSHSRPWPTALMTGIVLTLSILSITPNLFQTLYWVNGTANYAFPTIVTVGLIAVLVRVARLGFTRVRLWMALLFTIIAAGGQATTAVFVVGGLAISLLIVWWFNGLPYRRGLFQILLPAFAIAVLIALVVVLTPGNDVRQAALATYGVERQSLPQAVVIAAIVGLFMLIRTIGEYGAVTHILLIVGALSLAFWLTPKQSTQNLVHPIIRRFAIPFALFVGWGVFALGVFPSALTLGRFPALRAWIVPQMAWLIVVFLAGYIAGLNLRGSPTRITLQKFGAIGILTVVALFSLQLLNASSMARQMQRFATDHDNRIERIEIAISQREPRAVTLPFDSQIAYMTALGSELDQSCMSLYYEIEVITAEPEL